MIRWFKPVVFLACLIPLGLLGWKAYSGGLGANPIEVITHATGDWTLRFLLITLAITPIRKLTGQLWLIRYRRMFGLFAFFYGVLHFITYIWLDKFFDLHEMLARYSEASIHHGRIRRIRFADPPGDHFDNGMDPSPGRQKVARAASPYLFQRDCRRDPLLWLVKADIREPLKYGVILAVLLGYRIAVWAGSKRAINSQPRRRESFIGGTNQDLTAGPRAPAEAGARDLPLHRR